MNRGNSPVVHAVVKNIQIEIGNLRSEWGRSVNRRRTTPGQH
jgi:hypothetical protein